MVIWLRQMTQAKPVLHGQNRFSNGTIFQQSRKAHLLKNKLKAAQFFLEKLSDFEVVFK
jgi:hypothetical protein